MVNHKNYKYNNLKYIMENKRGGIISIITLIIFLVTFSIFLIITYYVTDQIEGAIRNSSMNDSEAVRDVLGEQSNINAQLDNVYMILFAGLCLSVLLVSFIIDANPIWIPIYIILFGSTILVGVIMNRVYVEFYNNATLTTIAQLQTYQTAIMSNFIPIILGIGVLSMIIIYGKWRFVREQRI